MHCEKSIDAKSLVNLKKRLEEKRVAFMETSQKCFDMGEKDDSDYFDGVACGFEKALLILRSYERLP